MPGAVAHGDPLLGPRAVGRPQLQPGARAGVGGGHVERQAAGGVAHGHVAAAGVLDHPRLGVGAVGRVQLGGGAVGRARPGGVEDVRGAQRRGNQ